MQKCKAISEDGRPRVSGFSEPVYEWKWDQAGTRREPRRAPCAQWGGGGGRAHAQTGPDATAPHFSSTSREPGGRPSAFCRNTTSCPGVHLPERPTMCRRRDGKPAEREHGVRGKGGGPRKRVQERFQSPEVLAVRRVPAGSGEKVPERGLRLETGERLSI